MHSFFLYMLRKKNLDHQIEKIKQQHIFIKTYNIHSDFGWYSETCFSNSSLMKSGTVNSLLYKVHLIFKIVCRKTK